MKIAVIGCSHSDYFWADATAQHPGWVQLMATDHPDHEFHNYSKMAAGSVYYDFVLKYIISQKINYDAVILQASIPGRWMTPLKVYKKNSHGIPFPFNRNKISENYFAYYLNNTNMFNTAASTVLIADGYQDPRAKKLERIFNEIYEPHDFASMYDDMFTRTCYDTYSHFFKEMFVFDFFKSINPEYELISGGDSRWQNIGRPDSFLTYCSEKYGHEKLVMEILDDTLHPSTYGHSVLWNDYLKPSILGDFLNNKYTYDKDCNI